MAALRTASTVSMALSLWCGCGTPPATSAQTSNHIISRPPDPLDSACPLLDGYIGQDREVWLSAVFPQCSPEPFEYSFRVCGADCPRPCRLTRSGFPAQAIHYDTRGRWLETMGDHSLGCTYDRDHVVTCWRQYDNDPRQTSAITWSETGRIRAVDNNQHIEITYEAGAVAHIDIAHVAHRRTSANTDVREVGPVTTRISFFYDAQGRLVREDLARGKALDWVVSTTYGYDARGKLESRRNEDERTRFVYDAGGQLVRVEATELKLLEPGGPVHRSIALEYDAAGRLIADRDEWYDSVSTHTYDYECR